MTTKQVKRFWHDLNRPFVYWYFSGICQECNKKIYSEKWDVHHLNYDYPNLYYAYWLELIENNVITLVHRNCHNKIHTGTVEEIKDLTNLKNSTFCDWCGCSERGIFDRSKTLKTELLLCKKCFQNWKQGVQQLNLFER